MPSAASPATRWCTRKPATTSPRSRRRSDVAISRCLRHRSRVATAIRNSSSARAVVERLLIDHVAHRGDGVAFADGQAVYVPYTLGGETVEVAPVSDHPDRRRLLTVERTSPERVAPFCPHFGICGGCAIQHWEVERYRAWKRDIVIETLAQAKLACEVDALMDAHGLGRRRITLHARMGTHDVLKVGFAAANSHDIIPVDRCPILAPNMSGALDAGWAIPEPLISIGKARATQITATDGGLDVDLRGSGPLPAAKIAALSRIAEQHRLARLTRHGEVVVVRNPPTIARHGARRGGAGEAGGRTLRARQKHRRSLLWRRAVRVAACSEVAGFGVRQRCRGDKRAQGGVGCRTGGGQGR